MQISPTATNFTAGMTHGQPNRVVLQFGDSEEFKLKKTALREASDASTLSWGLLALGILSTLGIGGFLTVDYLKSSNYSDRLLAQHNHCIDGANGDAAGISACKLPETLTALRQARTDCYIQRGSSAAAQCEADYRTLAAQAIAAAAKKSQ